MRYLFWTIACAVGGRILDAGRRLYWAGRRGQQRNKGGRP